MSKCLIIKMLMLMWTHQTLDMTEQDRINAINQTELIYEHSINNNFDPFAIFSIVYHESRFRDLADMNTASCGAFQIAHAYVPFSCEQLKVFRISLEVAFDYHLNEYINRYNYSFKANEVFDSNYKSKNLLINIFRLYASGPNCTNPEDKCFIKAANKAKIRFATRNRLQKIFLENYKNHANYFHLVSNQKCTK